MNQSLADTKTLKSFTKNLKQVIDKKLNQHNIDKANQEKQVDRKNLLAEEQRL